jgi:hypothetical protein
LKKIFFALFLTSVSGFSAQTDDFQVSASIANKKLSIEMKEMKVSNNACDLVVEKMQYFHDLRLLDIQLMEVENCPLDVVGQRKAHLEWTVPFNFAAKKSLHIRVNGKVRAKISTNTQN